jgi:DNA-binding NtrC family response regulator
MELLKALPLEIDLFAFAADRLCDAVEHSLADLGHHVHRSPDAAGAVSSSLSVFVVAASTGRGRDAVAALRERAGGPSLALVDASAQESIGELMACCSEFALWPCGQEELAFRLRRIASASALDNGPSDSFCQGASGINLIGSSAPFLDLLRRLERFAASDAPVLLEGETGTGKELAARAVHYNSRRRDHPFIPINCGALPEHLVENELFGHEKGAYTGAAAPQGGLVEEARGGTLFLDEVEALTPKAQVSLLRFLQEQEYRPLGGRGFRKGDVRLIAASNAELEGLVGEGRFREDFLYRLNVLSVRLPPLRERSDDIPPLAEHFLRLLNDQYGGAPRRLDLATLDWMQRFEWPGNVRELENFLHREFVLADGPIIRSTTPAPATSDPQVPALGVGFQEAKARAIDAFERRYLTRLMEACRGNVTAAARLAGKERRALGKLLRKHGIDRTRYLH